MAFFIGLEEIPLSLGKMDWLAIKAVSPIWGNLFPGYTADLQPVQ